MNKSLFSFVWHNSYACFKKQDKISTQLLSCLYGFITKCKKKKKKIDAAGTKFPFVLYPGFMSEDLIPSVSHQPLWQCDLVRGWRGGMSLTLLGLRDSNMIFQCLSLHNCKACLILRKCFFSK